MNIAGVRTNCQPLCAITQGQTVDICKLVASPHLLDHLARAGVEYPDLDALLGSGHQFLAVLAYLHGTQDYGIGRLYLTGGLLFFSRSAC